MTSTDTGTGTINNDDSAAVTVNDADADEGDGMTFTVTLDKAVQGGLTVTPGYTNGTAADADYTKNTAALTFSGTANETKTFTVSTTEDALLEGDETFTVGLTVSGTSLGVTATDTGTGTIDNDDGATVTVNNADADEGESMTFTVTLGEAVQGGLTVTPGYTNGTAAATDYTANTTALSFTGTKGETKTFTVATTEDAVLEGDETFTVGLSTSNQAVTSTDTGTGTINNDDSAAVTVNDADADEGDGMTFTVTLDKAVQGGLTVTPGYTNGTAADADYTKNTAALTFSGTANETKTFTVSTTEDALLEGAETFTVDLTVSGTSLSVSAVAGTGTINNDDGATVTVNNADADEGESMTFTVTLGAAVQGGLTVTPGYTNGTAAATDYTKNTTALSFTGTKGETKTFTVATTEDAVLEGDETFTVGLSTSNQAVTSTDTGTGTINNDDGAAVTVNDADADEGDGITFTVTLGAAVQGGLTVTPGYTDGTAAATDYTKNTAALTFSGTANETKTFTVSTTEDDLVEGAETFTVGLSVSGTSLAVGATDTGTGTIDNDDGATVTVNNASADEGDGMTFTVTLGDAVQGGLTVTPGYTNGTADGSDYTANTAALSFIGTKGETKAFTVATTEDDVFEGDETFTVGLSASKATVVSTDTGTGTINNDDGAPAVNLSLSPSRVGEGAPGTPVTVTAAFSNRTVYAADRTVTVSVGGGTATSGTDYAAVADFDVTIAGGRSSGTATFTLTPTDDTLIEGDETVGVAGTAAGLTVSGATLTLTDDDGAPSVNLSLSPSRVGEGAGATTVAVTAAFSNGNTYADDRTVTVSVGGGGTATPGTDYAAVPGFDVTIAAGQTSGAATFTLTPTDDDLVEGDETVGIAGTATGLTVNGAELTLSDNEGNDPDTAEGPSAVDLSVSPAAAGEGDGATAVAVTAAFPAGATLATDTTVTVSVGGGTATPGTDYAAVPGFDVTIAAGQTSGTATFTLTPTQDTLIEGDETIGVAGTATGLTVNGTELTLSDDDGAPSVDLSLSPTRVGEGAGATTVAVTAAFSGGGTYAADRTVTVSVGGGGTATSGTDYAAVADFDVTIAAGRTSGAATFTLTPTQDTLIEGDETIGVAGTAAGLTVTGAELTLTDDDGAPSVDLSLSPSTVAEGAGATTVTVTAAFSNGSTYAADRTVTVSVGGGTAASGTDYAAVPSFDLTIPAGRTGGAATFTLTPTPDTLIEDDETVGVAGTATDLTVNGAELTLTDDDGTPAVNLSAAPATVGEGDGATAVTVTATFSTNATFADDTTVTVSVGGAGTAAPGTDYAAVTDFDVTIPAGGSSGTADFTLTPADDTLVEGDETVGVAGAAAGLTVNGTALTLSDDDAAPAVNLSAVPAAAGEGDGAAAVTVTATFSTNATFADDTTVTVSVGGGTAAPGADYAAVSSFDVTIPAGGSSGTADFTLTPTDDTLVEGDETIGVAGAAVVVAGAAAGVAGAAPGLTVNGTEITLTDDDDAPAVNLSLSPSSVGEGAGATAVTVTAAFSSASTYAADTTVTVSVGGGGTATSGTDYAAVTDFDVTIPAGGAGGAADFTLTPTDDNEVEGDETVGVAGAAPGLTVNGAELTLTDDDGGDDDGAAPTLSLSVDPARGREGGEVVFNVTLSHAVEETIVVEYATADGTAAAGTDYAATNGQLVFAPGETTHAVRVPLLNDQVVEEQETFTLTVQMVRPQGAAPTGTPAPVPVSASGTILDGDTAAVAVSEPVVEEVDGEAVFRITLAPQYAFGITLLYAAVDGTASAGADYVATSGRLVFAPGERTSQVSVPVLNDEVAERVETFTLVLDPDAASGLERVTAEATIRDDDLAEQRAEETSRTLYLLARSIASEAVSAVGERFVDGGDASPQLTLGSAPTAVGGVGVVPGLGGGAGRLSAPWGAGYGGAAGFGGVPGHGGAAGYGGAAGFGYGGPVMPMTDEAFADLAWLDNANFSLPLQFGQGADEGPGPAGGGWTVWGRAGTVRSQLQSESGAQTRGDVFTSHVGLETRPRPSVLVGAALSHSVGKLGYTVERPPAEDGGLGGLGEGDGGLTAVEPYVHWAPRRGLTVWGMGGFGRGSLTVTDALGTVETPLGMRLFAGGGRQELSSALAVKVDAFHAALRSDEQEELAEATGTGTATRYRGLLEWRADRAVSPSSSVSPRVEAGVRWDGGSDLEGAGAEVGGGLAYVNRRLRLGLETQVRYLLAHQAAGFEEWGTGVAVRLGPGGDGPGPWLALEPQWGASASRVQGLWDPRSGPELHRGAATTPGASPDRMALTTGWRLSDANSVSLEAAQERYPDRPGGVAVRLNGNLMWGDGSRLGLFAQP